MAETRAQLRKEVARFTRDVVSPAIAEKQRKLKKAYVNSRKKWTKQRDVDLEAMSDALDRSHQSVKFHIEKILLSALVASPLGRPVLDELSRDYGRTRDDIVAALLVNHNGRPVDVVPRLPQPLHS